ncbi:MAG: cysteine hydrolase family protein [Bacteriovoracia bacterium]
MTNRQNLALITIDVQKGFLDPYWGKRNNPDAENNITDLISGFRKCNIPVIHIQHLSKLKDSPLRPGQKGVEFIEQVAPEFGDRVFQKTVNSAFIGTLLEQHLREQNITSLVLVGFTTDHCVSTTTRMAANLGFNNYVVSDATATFDRSIGSKVYSADLVHKINLASLQGEFASVLSTQEFLSKILEIRT